MVAGQQLHILGHIADIHRNLPGQYHKVLPVLTAKTNIPAGPPWRFRSIDYSVAAAKGPGTPRIYHLALEPDSGTDARFTRDLLIEFLQAYQQHATDDCRTLGFSSHAWVCVGGRTGTTRSGGQPPSE
jgi:hypothetical protein